MMNAAFYTGDRRIEIRPTEGVPPAPGMAQVEVAYTGICGTDLHIVHGAMDARVGRPRSSATRWPDSRGCRRRRHGLAGG